MLNVTRLLQIRRPTVGQCCLWIQIQATLIAQPSLNYPPIFRDLTNPLTMSCCPQMLLVVDSHLHLESTPLFFMDIFFFSTFSLNAGNFCCSLACFLVVQITLLLLSRTFTAPHAPNLTQNIAGVKVTRPCLFVSP